MKKIISLFVGVLLLSACDSQPHDAGRNVLVIEKMRDQPQPRHSPQRQSREEYCPMGHHHNNWC